MDKNQILINKGTDYIEITKELLNKAALNTHIKDKSARIGIKPNLVAPTPAFLGATTHPEVVEGIIIYLRENGFNDITIMEGSWVGDKTADSMEVCGYTALCEKYNIPFIDTQKEKSHTVKYKDIEVNVCDCVSKVDFMINVPVLKGHAQTLMTCALKNMKGLIPNSEKRRFHTMGLHKPIAHLGLAIRQDFIVVDNICGDLTYEDGGNPVQMDRVFCGLDPVLIDAYVAHLLHLNIDDVEYIKISKELGVGSADISKADIKMVNDELIEALPLAKNIVKVKDVVTQVDSCSACYGSLIPALDELDQEGLLEKIPGKICIGQGFKNKSGAIGIGHCTAGFEKHLKGCPPSKEEIYNFLKHLVDSST